MDKKKERKKQRIKIKKCTFPSTCMLRRTTINDMIREKYEKVSSASQARGP
jgi:hypothetical protein